MSGAARRPWRSVSLALRRSTFSRRERGSVHRLFRGRARWRDDIPTRLYYLLSARHWAQRARTPDHLAPFVHGLAWCAPPARALDLGTGAGATARLLGERFPEATIVGLDRSRAMLREARRAGPPANVDFVRGSLGRLGFATGSVDLVTALNVFPELGEVARVLRPGGVILMSSSFGRLEDRSPEYQARWRECGFQRERAADIDGGNCELFSYRPAVARGGEA